jgi:hypothetical protein
MGDSVNSKVASRSSSRGSNSNASLGNRDFSPRPDLEAQLRASPSPVSSAKDARSWLEKKGWMLNSENYTKNKLADILFSASLSFKIPPEANTAIRSVAYLIRDLADEEHAASLTDKIIDQLTNKLIKPISSLDSAVTSAKNFLDATSQQQASDLLNLQESISKQSEFVKSLANSSEKVNQASNPRGLADSNWPLLSSPPSALPQGVHPASLLASPSNSPATSKIRQRVSLASKQLMIEYGPLGENELPRDKSVESQRALKQLFNNWVDTNTPVEEGAEQPSPSRVVRSVTVFDRPAILLEFESDMAKDKFIEMCADHPDLLVEINSKARICPRTYTIILRFVPCTGHFDPSNTEHLRDVERDNDLPPGSISSASWCKRPEKRSPNQKSATLKVQCSNPTSANLLITGRIRVADQLVNARKDIRLPIRCVKCQEYGHIQDACIGVEKCANCASENHSSTECSNSWTPNCVSCGVGSTHPSTSPKCPTFIKKCEALDERFPENAMPYFPTKEAWTWAASPVNPPRPSSPSPPLPMRPNPRLRSPRSTRQPSRQDVEWSQPSQTDNGWPNERRQSTLHGFWGSQPEASSSNTRNNHPPPSTQ